MECNGRKMNVKIRRKVSGSVTHVNEVQRHVRRVRLDTDVEEERNPILRHHVGHVTPGDATVPLVRNERPSAQSLDDA
jgi:hypothetical protein